MRRSLIPLLLLFVITGVAPFAVAAATPATAKGAEYNAVVKLIESHYRVKHRGVPFVVDLGVATAKVVSKSARRLGSFKLAIFEDQDFTGRDAAPAAAAGGDIRARLRRTLEPAWHPLVAARLEEEAQTYTYTKSDGDKFKVLIVVIAQRDASVLQVSLNPEDFAKLLLNPERESRELTNEAASAEQE
ncbi:MAG TPA: hypothetical protein VEY11_11085 [Pyrinomonadaceae bacterium]|nr:hypothetical protein [Pyrinomonadaceae bacterium]